ncbi:MAG: Unknown protein [uncultured Sulfurovum sp.]|uniref:ATPase AAA-type core domain-containing protein n=1 Tax=uncultured Sulfurovum sp. TaxID=269237 RepID=A0A6S6U172_9BACT|nr:MAG: Unknown protein [uncultured Sulfurovum sp.]
MELVYLWVEDYKNIQKQGFNFSPKFSCAYDEKNNKLTIDENDDYIENFFGENINVTAIVGKNGSGKSSLLEILTNSLSTNNEKNYVFVDPRIDCKFFLIYQYEGQYYLVQEKLSFNLNIESSPCKLIRLVEQKLFEKHKELISIVLNNELTSRKDFSDHWQFFINDTKSDINEIQKIIASNFIKNRNSSFPKNTDNFFIPTKIEIKSVYSGIKIDQDFSIEDVKKNIKAVEKKYAEDSSYLSTIEKSDFHTVNTFGLEKIDIKKLEDIFSLRSDVIDIEICSDIKSFKDLSYGERQLLTNLNFILFHTKKNEYETIEIYKGEEGKPEYNKETIKVNNILVLLDEVELGLHPSWQKKSMTYIINFLKEIDKKFDLIITSHSPFLLSDIPKKNIIFLDKDEKGNCKVVNGLKEKKQTFGANIHTLLSDSFFMEDGLMGEFAKSKIDKAIKLLNQDKLDEKELKYCEQIISIIGEPIVKNQLQRMLTDKKISYLAKDTREEIEFLKHRIDLLSKRL